MQIKSLQTKIAQSQFLFPICNILAAILWWMPEWTFSVRALLGMAVCALATYIVMETNNRMLIIRIRTRIMASTWVLLAACLPFMHPIGNPIVAATILCASNFVLFRCYECPRPQADAFHTFLLLSLGSFFAPILLLMAIPTFLFLAINLRSLTRKAFWASVLGIVAPYWCYAFWSFATKDMQGFLHHLAGMFRYDMPSIEALLALPFPVQFSIAFILFLCLVSIFHFNHTIYDDRIRVRMYLFIYLWQTLLFIAFLLLQPAQYETTLALLLASATPLISRFFAVSRSTFCTILAVLSILLTAAMAALYQWNPSFSFF